MSDVATRLVDALSGRYRVIRQVGVGGMATVFLAHDIRHERDVAIKVLLPELAAAIGGERFLAEIKTTAKLQHPHILPLLDSGAADGLLYYVMPYIPGETLRGRLERETQLPVDEAVRIAREALSALESAHKHGVVHRDIKPENILLHEGQALVADFGISLAVSAAAGPRLTQTGLSLGTPAYMSPEQAMGERTIGARADIYAMGAVLYEMIVGEAPFTGPTVQAILARVMTEDPRPLTAQRRSVPAHVDEAVMRALEKLPADRFSSALEFSNALASPGPQTVSRTASLGARREPAYVRGLRSPVVAWGVAGALALAAAALLLRPPTDEPEPEPIHLAVELPPNMLLDPSKVTALELSRDGSMMAIGVSIGGVPHLAIRRLSSDSVRLVPGSAGFDGGVAFSPDGRWLAFRIEDRLVKAPVAGGAPTVLASASFPSVAWAGDDVLVYTADYDVGLRRISAEGRDSVVLTHPDRKAGELGHWWPQLLPDGDHVLFVNYFPAEKSRLEVVSLATGKRMIIVEGAYYGRYARGRLYFARAGAMMSAPFDARALRLTGAPVALEFNVAIQSANGWAGFAVAENGTFAYLRGESSLQDFVWVDQRGQEEPALDTGVRVSHAIVSPDGRRLGVIRDDDIWSYDRERRVFTRLTRTDHPEGRPVFTADSREIIFERDVPQYDLFRRVVDASRPEELLLSSPRDKSARSVSPDNRTLLYEASLVDGKDLLAVGLDSATRVAPEVIAGGPGHQENGIFSPDGKWVAYSSNESGRSEVYLTPYPPVRDRAREQVSVEGGEKPAWSRDGGTVYFAWAGRIHSVAVNPSKGQIGTPRPLPAIDRMVAWSVAPDGRFLVGKVPANAATRSVSVVLNHH